MGRKSFKVEVDPSVFKWLRESAGWSIEEVSKKIKTSVSTVEGFENGEKKPTLKQLKELSRAFRRPTAAFLLSKPKKEKPLPKDYRMLPNRTNTFDKKTIIVLRRARNLQEVSEELSININYKVKPEVKLITDSYDPKKVATEYRNLFQLTEEKQCKFKTPYELFHYLRDILEGMNVLVFQFSMPVEDARGFVLVDESPNVIVVNTKDSIEARLFSLMHEFAHILLGESVIDLPDSVAISRNKIEVWCNEFASSFLLPENMAKNAFDSKKEGLTQTQTLNTLSRKYKISKAVILVKMLKLNYITKNEYDDVLGRYKPKPEATEKGKKQGGGLSSDKKCLSQIGNKFISIVARNYDKNYITYTDALSYLSIKSKNFD
ncbi:zinc peptidase, partial [Candidatus Micrarchaeota archaeon CG_4_10_14_0_2_um_filter_55_9]